ncbi:axin interactor, dorsalization-associated protein-like [Oscarella lobularis]|uniref:axin interactor, dorsalization-associated protein-like n=1 Tax=Oscarella lobularis TaxID=121494 RepID=UPI003313CF53
MAAASERQKFVELWSSLFVKATDFDSWGQIVEAVDEYSRLIKRIRGEIASDQSSFDTSQCATLWKIVACLEMRKKSIQSEFEVDDDENFSLEQLKSIDSKLKGVADAKGGDGDASFPISIDQLNRFDVEAEGNDRDDEEEEKDEDVEISLLSRPGQKALKPRLPLLTGMTLVTIKIEKIGLKDAGQLMDPFITVSVKDGQGVDMTPVQDTPVSSSWKDRYVNFNVSVEIQQYLEKLPKTAAVFFEFKHYKPKKRLISTKCFAFMEMDEIKPGPGCLEIYKKPTDFKRKRLGLLSTKPLYLHLNLTLHKA